ncbi:hypothetical protein [Actinomadura macra]|uniref:hypothetical protein n=1 Tax=Actinomadura macra TaxID=46164 RepID=UPI000AB209E9|nr:hypothetical protein [Actinomadura macra]
MHTTPPPAHPPTSEIFARLFAGPETLIAPAQAHEYTKKDGDSDQPHKYDEM